MELLQMKKNNIVALVSLPNFNPNENHSLSYTNNGVINNIFEFGSTIKIFSFLCGLENNIITKNTNFNLSEGGKIGEYKISDVSQSKGFANVENIFVKSSNVGTIQISELIYMYIGNFFKNLMLNESANFLEERFFYLLFPL